jgi:serine/threonine protein kinase
MGSRRFLVRCAGADPGDLVDPNTGRPFTDDITRYTVMGMAVCVTASFSAAALIAALSLATGRFAWPYLLFGLLWGLFVFNLDRWVVSSVNHGQLHLDGTRKVLDFVASPARVLAQLLVRLSIAVLIGLSISEPIVMLVFDTEIQGQLTRGRDADRAAAAQAVEDDPKYANMDGVEEQELNSAKARLDTATTRLADANKALDEEQGGSGGTGDKGFGDRTQERRDDLRDANAEFDSAQAAVTTAQAKYDAKQGQIEEAQRKDLAERVRIIDGRVPGLLDREEALSTLATEDSRVNTSQWVFRGLILLVDLAPVLLKLVSPKTPYERELRARAANRVSAAQTRLTDELTKRTHRSRLEIEEYEKTATHDQRSRIEEHAKTVDVHARTQLEIVRREEDLRARRAVAAHTARIEHEGLLDVVDHGLLDLSDGQTPLRRRKVRTAQDVPRSEPPQTDDALFNGQAAGNGPVDGTTDGAGVRPRNVLGFAGRGIEQYVGERWRLGQQIITTGHGVSWRVPYIAEDLAKENPEIRYYAVKRIQQPHRNNEYVSAINEYQSLPVGREISPYVTPVVARGYDDAFGWYLVTPYYQSGTLQQLMDSGTALTLGNALTYAEQVLEGLLSAFTYRKMSLVHFDIKPSNIAFDDDGQVRIIDWGLADRPHDAEQTSLGATTGFTLWYAPPEQVSARPGSSINWKSSLCDIRAVAAVLYAMITGRPPLHLEAWHAQLLDADMNLQRERQAEFVKLLYNVQPTPLVEFFTVNQGWDAAALKGLSDLVSRWLHPQPDKRIAQPGPDHNQLIALNELREVVDDIRATNPSCLSNDIGITVLDKLPFGAAIDVSELPDIATDKRVRPNLETVFRDDSGESA